MSTPHLLGTYPHFSRTMVRGEGMYLYDDQGEQYLDFLSGIAVVGLGHSHPEIARVASMQFDTLQHVSNYFENEYTERVARKINDKILEGQNSMSSGKVFFANSGAEANECALKIAKRYGEGKKFRFATALGSFHGRTLATLSATGQPAKHERFEPLPDYFTYFEYGNTDSLNECIDDETVAVMIEVIQGEGGVRQPDQKFFDSLSRLCSERNLLLIVDEIQTGMCRTGKWFGFHHFGLQPDIVTMAKALGNGIPVGACWSRDEVADVMSVGDHGSTFGGQPFALSIVDTVINILDRDDLASNAALVGDLFRDELMSTGLFTEVRGRGLIVGADIDAQKITGTAGEFVLRCLDNGLVINATSENTIRCVPPLIVSREEVFHAIDVMKKSA